MNVVKFFENPDVLWNMLWLIPLFVALSYYAVGKKKKLCMMLLGDRFDNPEFSNLSRAKRNLKSWLIAFALVLLVVTASRPFWGMKILPYSGSGRDLMIVLDVSKSMLAEDVKPSRIDHAKWFLRELIKSTPGDRYGLVAFSGSAFLECPMTVDKTSIFQIIDEMHPGSIPLGGTNIENSINVALEAFQAAETPHRAIILVTDGDELQGNMEQTSKKLIERHIPLYVVGVGDPTQPGLVMSADEETGKKSFLKDAKGEIVKSSLNENALAKLANECDGIYVRSTATKSCLQPLLNKINTLVPEKYRTGQNTRNIERFHIPLFFAVVLLLLTMLIGETRKSAVAMLLLSFTLSGFSQDNPVVPPTEEDKPPVASVPGEGAKKVQNGDPRQENKKLTPEQLYNEAVELHQKKDIKNANERYQRAINSSGAAEVRGKSFQNLGVIIHEEAREMMKKMDIENAEKLLNRAEEMYRESMASDKVLADTAMNQQKLINDRKMLEEMKKKQKEMQDKKNEAKDKTQKAMDKNKEAQNQENKDQKNNKDNKDQKDQQKNQKDQQKNKEQKDQENQKDQQQNQKDQQNKDQQNQQKNQQKNQEQKKDPSREAQEKTEEAQKAVDDYKKEAQKQNSQQDQQSAQNAEKELDKAKQEQKKDDFKKAEENLKKALEALGGKEDKDKKEQDKNKENKQEQQKPEQDKKGQNDDKKLPKPQDQSQAQPQEQKEEEIDPNQAEALLDLMKKDEKDLRDQLKEISRQNSRVKEVDKDW